MRFSTAMSGSGKMGELCSIGIPVREAYRRAKTRLVIR